MILNWLQEKINQKSKEKIYHTNVNVNLTIENVIQIKSRIVINVDVSIKHFMKENVHVFKMITGKNESEILTKDIWWELNENLMKKNVIQIKSGIKINVDASVENVIYVKKNVFGILLHVVPEIENI